MTLTELQNEVIALTSRPDLAARILSAVRSSTLRCHGADTWYKDFVQVNHTFAASLASQTLDLRTTYPLFKGLKFIKVSDVAFTDTVDFIPIVPPENIFDSYNAQLAKVAYIAGQNVEMRNSAAFRYVKLGMYYHPDITTLGYNSWIAIENPYAIIYDATSIVLKGIGKAEEAASYDRLFTQQISLMSKVNVIPTIE